MSNDQTVEETGQGGVHPTVAMQPLLVDRIDAARLLAVCARTIDSLIDKKEIPVIKFGRAVRIDVEDLRGWIARNKSTAA